MEALKAIRRLVASLIHNMLSFKAAAAIQVSNMSALCQSWPSSTSSGTNNYRHAFASSLSLVRLYKPILISLVAMVLSASRKSHLPYPVELKYELELRGSTRSII
jgi:hypothetical protein